MTGREKEIFNIVKELGTAHPREIGKRMGISSDYAEQLCRDMVWLKHFVKKGLSYSLALADENMKSSGIE
jgi:hypothetical protein